MNIGNGLSKVEILKIQTKLFPKIEHKAVMGNLRPFKIFSVALLKPLKYAYFIEKSTKSVEEVSILALDMTF